MTHAASRIGTAPGGPPPRPCPVCGGMDHEVLYRQRFEHFAAGSIADGYDVVACRSCGMCFASGLPDGRRFAEYYDRSSKYDMGAEVSPFDAERFVDEARFVAEHVADRDVAVLDIGTATGSLLVALRGAGFTSVHGVEPSPDAARVAREVNGLDVVVGGVAEASALADGFGVVCLIAVLEHLVDPGQALKQIVPLLGEKGVLYLHVPDAARFQDHVDAPYQQFSVEHINYFTPGSLRNVVASVGLEVVAERRIVVRESADATLSAVEVLCRTAGGPGAIEADRDGRDALASYVARSAEREASVIARISALANDQIPLYVWGTGTHALHLLATSRLAECDIVGFVDSNPHYAGRRLAGRTVYAPRDVGTLTAPILVASAISQTAIAENARRVFGPDVPLILLY
jgi:SAM-dependent methyltransferase